MRSILLSVLLAALPSAAALAEKIAVVNTDAAISNSEPGVKAQATLRKLFDARQAQLEARQRDIAKEKQALDKEAPKLSRDVLEKRSQALMAQITSVQQEYAETNREMAQKTKELLQPIEAAAHEAIAKIAAQEAYDLVIERSAVPYMRAPLDITDKVTAILNGKK